MPDPEMSGQQRHHEKSKGTQWVLYEFSTLSEQHSYQLETKKSMFFPRSVRQELPQSAVDLKRTMMKQYMDGRGKWLKEFSDEDCTAHIISRALCASRTFPRESSDWEHRTSSQHRSDSKQKQPAVRVVSNSVPCVFMPDCSPSALTLPNSRKSRNCTFCSGYCLLFLLENKWLFKEISWGLLRYQVTVPCVTTAYWGWAGNQEPKNNNNNNSSAYHLLPDGKQNNQASESEHILIGFFKWQLGYGIFVQINNSSYNFTDSDCDKSKARVVPVIAQTESAESEPFARPAI